MASNRERMLLDMLLEANNERNQLLLDKQLLTDNLALLLRENEKLTAENHELIARIILPGLTHIYDIDSDSE